MSAMGVFLCWWYCLVVEEIGEMQMIIDYVNRTKKLEVESASDAVKAGICAALCVVVFGLLMVML